VDKSAVAAAVPPDVRKVYGLPINDRNDRWGYALIVSIKILGIARIQAILLSESRKLSAHQAAQPQTDSEAQIIN